MNERTQTQKTSLTAALPNNGVLQRVAINTASINAVLAGCREHWVVAGETRAKIAAQNGVAEADLVRANPDIPMDVVNEWPALAAGQKILIPVH